MTAQRWRTLGAHLCFLAIIVCAFVQSAYAVITTDTALRLMALCAVVGAYLLP